MLRKPVQHNGCFGEDDYNCGKPAAGWGQGQTSQTTEQGRCLRISFWAQFTVQMLCSISGLACLGSRRLRGPHLSPAGTSQSRSEAVIWSCTSSEGTQAGACSCIAYKWRSKCRNDGKLHCGALGKPSLAGLLGGSCLEVQGGKGRVGVSPVSI